MSNIGIENYLTYDEIKNILHVKEKERDTFVQATAEKEKKLREKVNFLRSVNDDIRREIAFHKSGGKHVVSKIFVTRPKEKPLMKNKDLKTSWQLMDQKAFEKSREICKRNYELQMARKKLADKQMRLEDFKQVVLHNPAEKKIKDFLKAQSQAELVKMKVQDAINTSAYYKKIIHCLQKDIFDMSQEIKRMTRCQKEKLATVNNIHSIRDDILHEFKLVQNQMRPLHTMIEMKTRDFEDNLRLKRKEFMEQRHDTSAKCVAELKMDTVEDDNIEARKAKELAVSTELKTYQDAFEEVKAALDISDVKEVLNRVQEEHTRYRRLCDQLEESNVLYDTLCADLDDLRDELASLTYHPAPPSMSPKDEVALTEEAEQQMARVETSVAAMSEKEKTIAGIKLATVSIHSKLIYVRMQAGETSTLVGDAAKDMELIWLKAEKLVERYASGIIAGESHTSKELQKFMEIRMPEDNLRSVLRPLDYRSRDNLRYDFDDVQASYISREDIKKRHREILKPKKPQKQQSRKNVNRGSKK